MSIIAECIGCKCQLRLPERAVGHSLECPKCGSFFMVVPMSQPGSAPAPAILPGAAGPAVLLHRHPTAPAHVPAPARAASAAPPVKETAPSPWVMPRTPGSKRQLSCAVVALFLGSIAFPFAAHPRLHVLTILVAGLGLMVGLVGVAVVVERGTGFVFAGVAAVVCALVVAIGMWPQLLYPAFQPALPDTNGDWVLPPRPKNPGVAPGWLDASRAEVECAHVGLRVEDVQVRTVRFADGKGAKEKGLVIVLRLRNAGGAELRYRGWGGSGSTPTLRDDTRPYRYRPLQPRPVKPGAAPAPAITALLPGQPVEEALAFEAPGRPVAFLRLELPAAAFGGDRVVRLQIPGNMVKGP
jgi:hypothetical protein